MKFRHKKEAILLLFGDIVILVVSLWIALFLRQFELVSKGLFLGHLEAFGYIIASWILVYFISGLYEKHTMFLKSKIPTLILNAQFVCSGLAILFFYIIPYFNITPKITLFIYIVVSFGLMVLWRIKGVNLIHIPKRESALLIGSGEEIKDLYDEVNGNPRYEFSFISCIDINKSENLDFQEEILKRVYSEEVSVIAIDLHNEKVGPILKHLYNLIFSQVKFVDMHKVYEDIFDRVPLSLVKYNWFLENISIAPRYMYDVLKRVMDLVVTIPLFIISLPFYVVAWVLVKFDDDGDLFFAQERIGKNNQVIKILKFRSMSDTESGKKVTKIGNILRKTRIDELPQLWNVIKGDISLIGPRPEIGEYVKHYETEIPYYNVRHLIKPGLSGWAQIHQEVAPKFKIGVEETKAKLSYDFYYIKNRSFMLDLKIALQTIKTLLSRSGV